MKKQYASHAPVPVQIPLPSAGLNGDLMIPHDAKGLVIFVHGSGSSRLSPRNRHVAGKLNSYGIATLLLDLLTEEEQRIDAETMQFRFDIPLLVGRCILVTDWVARQPDLNDLPIGLFGASTGTAAALITAADTENHIAAVVSRGGRPDLAEDALGKVTAPTLFLVGELDKTVLQVNKRAMGRMTCPTDLHVIPGASHLFEEPGTLEKVAELAAEWFLTHAQQATALQHAAS